MKEEFKWLLGRVLNDYYKNSDIKEEISRISFEDAYQNNLIRFFMSEVTNEYIDTPLTESEGIKLLYVKNGLILVKQLIPAVTQVIDSELVPTTNVKLTSSNLLDTEDENYQSSIAEIKIPLYHNGNVYDEINGTDLIRRLKEFRLIGEEDWEYEGNYVKDNVYFFRYSVNLDTANERMVHGKILCDKLSNADVENELFNVTEGVHFVDDKLTIVIKATKVSNIVNDEKIPENVQSIRLNEWKEYLSKKPIKVVCERETSVVESIGENPYSLNAFEGDTYIIIEDKNGLTPQLMFSYKIESAYREAILNSQTQAVTNHEDVNESIVPYLMDMEMNLMSLDDFGGGDI